MFVWRASNHVEALLSWVNLHYPHRDKASDGIKGDAKHAARPSDHNPDSKGIVRALDIDADLIPGAKDHTEAHRLADTIRAWGKQDVRPIAYVIFAGRIASPRLNWRWRKYTGTNPHLHHIHVSFRKAPGE